MAKSEIKPIKSEKEYRELKARVNKYEREWRKKNPAKHKEESRALITAIVKARTPKKKVSKTPKKVEQEVKNPA